MHRSPGQDVKFGGRRAAIHNGRRIEIWDLPLKEHATWPAWLAGIVAGVLTVFYGRLKNPARLLVCATALLLVASDVVPSHLRVAVPKHVASDAAK